MVRLKLRRATPALPERSWQKTNISLPKMKVKRDGFDGETDNLAGREGMCTRRVKPTQKSAGKRRERDRNSREEVGDKNWGRHPGRDQNKTKGSGGR